MLTVIPRDDANSRNCISETVDEVIVPFKKVIGSFYNSDFIVEDRLGSYYDSNEDVAGKVRNDLGIVVADLHWGHEKNTEDLVNSEVDNEVVVEHSNFLKNLALLGRVPVVVHVKNKIGKNRSKTKWFPLEYRYRWGNSPTDSSTFKGRFRRWARSYKKLGIEFSICLRYSLGYGNS